MQINFSQKVGHDESLSTEASLVLESLDATALLHHEVRSHRHPLATYNTSLQSVSSRIVKVLDFLEDRDGVGRFLNRQPTTWWESFAEATDAMLDALMEHMDDCGNVLLAFVPPDDKLGRQPAFRAYQSEVTEYRNRIGSIVNYIKHQQGRIRPCIAWHESNYLPGYYVEGPDGEGVLGPVESIHADGRTAFSFMRDVRYHLTGIYSVGASLAKAIRNLAGPAVGSARKKSGQAQDDLTKAVIRVAKYPVWVFKDEIGKPWPRLSVREQDGGSMVEIEYPSVKEQPRLIGSPTSFSSGSKGDGVSRSYRFPYLPEQTG